MEENNQNQAKAQISVPFVWEERPGEPKKDWKPTVSEPPPRVPLPVKYIASIPFKWEEKPGTPLGCFAQELTIQETVPENGCLPFPPAYLTKYWDESDEESSDGDEYDELNWMSDFEALSINSEESCSSAPSSSVVPLKNPFLMEENNQQLECASSPESSISQSRHAPGNASLRGALFLQQLFPLYPPKSGFLNKASSSNSHAEEGNYYKSGRDPPSLAEHKNFVDECRRSGVIKRPSTLAELIMMSRKRSYRRKAIHLKKRNRSRENGAIMQPYPYESQKGIYEEQCTRMLQLRNQWKSCKTVRERRPSDHKSCLDKNFIDYYV